jgi:tRNA G18 (ribose-2'-O)-methylase SpoU
MLEAADQRIFLPMFGFTESFNLSVATSMVLLSLYV